MKKLLTLLTVMAILVAQITNVQALETDSEYVIAIDLESGMVLYEKNADELMYPASMTKIVTAMVAIEAIEDMQEEVTITTQDLETIYETGASAAYYQVGEITTYKDLLYGVILPSGADACQALAYNLFGSLEAYVEAMNQYVEDLGLEDTHFMNTTGIHDDEHYTTASDMAAIVMAAISNETFLEIFCTRAYTTSNETHSWVNSAPYYGAMAGYDTTRIIGCKSGYTVEAQSCLASLVDVLDREVIIVTGHADSSVSSAAVKSTNEVIDYLEEAYVEDTFYYEGDLLATFEVIGALDDKTVSVYLDQDLLTYVSVDATIDDFNVSYSFETLQAPISSGEVLGTYTVEYNGVEIYSQEIIASEDIEQTLNSKLADNYLFIIVGVIGILIGICFGIRYFNKYKKLYLKRR